MSSNFAGRAALVISAAEREELERLRDSRKAPKRETERAAILLRYAAGEGPTQIQQGLGISRPTIYKCIDKALAAGAQSGLKDRYHRPKEPVITPEAKAWVLNLACTKPKDHGLAAELWTLSALARYTREHAGGEGHSSLARAGKATIWRILHAGEIKPQKVQYYLERRDAQFEQKMHEVLMVYQEVSLQNAARASGQDASSVITVSVDEKPGVQLIANRSRRCLGSTKPGAGIMSTSAMEPCPFSPRWTYTMAKSSRKFTHDTAAGSSFCCSSNSMSTTRKNALSA